MLPSFTELKAVACTNHLPVILLADDDADDRNFFAEALAMSDNDAKLVIVKDGEELMQYLESFSLPQIVFLDLNMPRKNGAQCLADIKRNPFLKELPVVILSTSVNEAKSNQLLEEGASFCFNKPCEYSELVTIIKKSMTLILHTSGM